MLVIATLRHLIDSIVYNNSSDSRICKTRRNTCAYIQIHYSIFEKDLVQSAFDPVTKESLLAQHGFYKERVGKEHYGDINTVTIFVATECIRLLMLNVHENSSERVGDDKLKGQRYVFILDSKVPRWLATTDRSARPETMHLPDVESLYFVNPFCELTGFLDSFSIAGDGADIRYMSKRDVLCMFRSVEQLYQFIMAESYTYWGRADEILAAVKPSEAARLGKQVRIFKVDCITSKVSTSRNAYDTVEWWAQVPNAMLDALNVKFYGNEELASRLLATSRRPLARAAKYGRRWGIACTLEEAQWGVEWNGSNWLGNALVDLPDTLENVERISSKYSGKLFREQEPLVEATIADLCASALAAVGNGAQSRDGDLHLAAQHFVGESHIQQAALFGMDQSGSILQPDCMGALFKRVKDLLQANTGVPFLGGKRSRPAGDQPPMHSKKPNGFVKKAG